MFKLKGLEIHSCNKKIEIHLNEGTQNFKLKFYFKQNSPKMDINLFEHSNKIWDDQLFTLNCLGN